MNGRRVMTAVVNVSSLLVKQMHVVCMRGSIKAACQIREAESSANLATLSATTAGMGAALVLLKVCLDYI